MGTTQDTVYLTQHQLENLLETLHSESKAPANTGGPADFRPVGRVDYEKRKYREIQTSYSRSRSVEIL